MPKPAKSTIFVQEIVPYHQALVVTVGDAAKKDLIKVAKTQTGFSAKTLAEIASGFSRLSVHQASGGAMVTAFEDGGYLLTLAEFKDEWGFWEMLIHETNHVVWFLSRHAGFENEIEAQAHLQAWLFRQIRRRLQGVAC